MRTATFPALRTTPATRQLAESVLMTGETLSQFIDDSLKRNIEHRQAEQAFVARALKASVARLLVRRGDGSKNTGGALPPTRVRAHGLRL